MAFPGAFQDSPIGRLVPIQVDETGKTVDTHAYIPNPLPDPDSMELPTAVWTAAINAGHMLGQLDAIARELLPNPALVARPTIRREAVSTSALEGTYAPASEVLSSEVDDEQPRSQAVTEILNFIRATEQAVTATGKLPICVRLARDLQLTLVRGTPSEDWQAGRVRQTQVFLGPYKGCSVRQAHFIPPPPGPQLEEGLAEWEDWIHRDTALHPVVRIALSHYQFESLHPFTDGNGRIGRLLAILQLMEYGLLGAPLINLSPYFEARDDQYRHLLRDVSTSGQFAEWVRFFCDALASQAMEAVVRIRALLAWRDSTLAELKRLGVKGVALDVASKLIEWPSVTVKAVAVAHNVSVQAANNAVTRLHQIGIVEEVTGRSYNRIFQAAAVIDLVFSQSS